MDRNMHRDEWWRDKRMGERMNGEGWGQVMIGI